MYRAGTVVELSAVEPHISKEVYREALHIVAMLDEQFGEERDVEHDDGGIVAIVLNEEDLTCFWRCYPDLDSGLFEYVELVESEKEPYLNVFYLYNEYAYGISLFLPLSIAPPVFREAVLQGLEKV